MFQGSIVALVTPMCPDGAIDWPAYDRLLDFHLEQGTDGLVINGTTGESVVLSAEESVELVARAKRRIAGRVPVIAGSGSNCTRRTVDLSRAMQNAGADALLVVTPYYNKPTQEGLFRHFSVVADAVSIPVILYNVPSRTAVDLLPDTAVRLAAHERIVAIKEATGIISRAREILSAAGPDFAVLSGDDPTVVDLMEAGAVGVISVTGNVAPNAMHEICRLALSGDFEGARKLDATLRKLHKSLFLESNPIPVKWAVAQIGLIGAGIRLPLTPLAERFHEPLRQAMAEAGVTFA
ncbi:MAG TPA: 4-hydroxy-tetrahydrodipicolinate synthase [Steroidobacteraceae bacterium]|nr:4-hydroxy-tetrahydrodipicolinate synthase [Steroidobacteraceae bacterium]